MKRLLLAGVSLTVTACSMPSATPPSTASLSTSRGTTSQYLLALAATPECTIWRDVGGNRICLDNTTPEPTPVAAAAPASRQASRLLRSTGQDARDFTAFQPSYDKAEAAVKPQSKPEAIAAKPADPRMPEIATVSKRESSLFVEMQRNGMIDAKMKAIGAPPRIAVPKTQQAQTQGLPQLPGFVPVAAELPRLPTATPVRTAGITTPPVMAPADLPQLPKAAQGVISHPAQRAVPVEQAFVAEPVMAAPKPVAAVSAPVPSPGWEPVASKPARAQMAQADTMGRAPVAPVERTELPSVRSNTVVPLRIVEKATDQRPAVIEPVAAVPMPITPAKIAANPGAAPELPPLPQLPGSHTVPAAQPMPAAASALPPPPPMVQPAAAVKPMARPAVQQPLVAPKMAQPAAVQSKPVVKPVAAAAKSAAKPAQTNKLAGMAPSAAPVQRGATRYLVIHSFTDQQKASQTAQKYTHLGATVATAQIQGQTWYRVVVRDGAAQRERLTADGVRVYWPVSL